MTFELLQETNCWPLITRMLRGNITSDRLQVDVLHYTPEGLVCEVTDTEDNQHYRITVEPIDG